MKNFIRCLWLGLAKMVASIIALVLFFSVAVEAFQVFLSTTGWAALGLFVVVFLCGFMFFFNVVVVVFKEEAKELLEMIKHEFPCYPGDEVWYLSSVGDKYQCKLGKVGIVNFTTQCIQIQLRDSKSFGETYIWGKTVFKTEHEALQMIARLCGTLEEE